MRIANLMFGRELGGIEQAFLDYNEALLMAGHEVLAVTHPLAQVNSRITGNLSYKTLANLGSWDVGSALKLRALLKEFRPDATITHGNRALLLARKAKKYAGLHVGVTHNYHLKYFDRLDLVFATTKDLQSKVVESGIPLSHIVRIPNMVRLPEKPIEHKVKKDGDTLIIGSMGRMIERKGFAQLIEAMAKIKAFTRVPFKLVIGGDGEEKTALEKLVKKHKLENHVEFCGWVTDKADFFQRCDVFCLPSLHEPFGIVLLEAMAYSTPIVAYDCEGPHDIFMAHPDAGMLCPVGDIGGLADRLTGLLQNPAKRKFLTTQARAAVEKEYSMQVVSQKIDTALKRYIHP